MCFISLQKHVSDHQLKTQQRQLVLNSFGTCTVLQFAREAGVKRVVYSSTSSAYGLHEPPHVEALPDDCLEPIFNIKSKMVKNCVKCIQNFLD